MTLALNNDTSYGVQVNLNASLPQNMDTLISDNFLNTFAIVLDMWMSLILSTFGVLSNVLTLVVFFRLGFKDTVNITMTAITAWDLIRVLCGSLHRMYGPISLTSEAPGKSWQNVTIINIVYLHIIAGNVSYVIGGYVALERCLCVSMPFKVRSILRPKFTITICLAVSICVFISQFPIFLVWETSWVYSNQYGQYVAIYKFANFYTVHGQKFMDSYRYFSYLYPTLSLMCMVISTIVISYNLQNSSRFRKYSSTVSGAKCQEGNGSEINTRDKKVVKMLLVVIAIYMVSLIPRVADYIAMLLIPEYYVLKFYNNLFMVTLYILFFLDFVISSVNLVIFYFMSSKFRKCARSLFDKLHVSFSRKDNSDLNIDQLTTAL